MNLLFVADVVGRSGRRAVSSLLPSLIEEFEADLCVLNGENAAGGSGITPAIANEFLTCGVDVITTGNHVWGNRTVLGHIDREPRLLRPDNMSRRAPGSGAHVAETRSGWRVLVMNLIGRVYMNPADCPFAAADRILESHPDVRLRFLDFHAEATSEKTAMGHYLDGRVTAVVGTHTHVPTADERILAGGTAYLTDAGMTGPHDSIIGVTKAAVIKRMTTGLPVRFETATGDVRLSSVVVEADPETGLATRIERIQRSVEG